MRSVQQRLLVLGVGAALMLGGVALLIWTLGSNLDGFVLPRDLAVQELSVGEQVSVGGCVKVGSLQAISDPVGSAFILTDGAAEIRVIRAGTLPDLFAEGELAEISGPITTLSPLAINGVKVLAKHDQNYRPKNAETALNARDTRPECNA